MEIAEKITLIASIFWVIWSMLSLRNAFLEEEGIFPASITSVLLFFISIVAILIFHLSPFHLIWLFVLSFPLGGLRKGQINKKILKDVALVTDYDSNYPRIF